MTEGERGRARSREIIFPSKLRLRRLDGKSERASGADLGGADGRTRKPRSALLRSGMRQLRWWTNVIAATYRSGGLAIAERGMGRRESGYFSAFVKSGAVAEREKGRSGRHWSRDGRQFDKISHVAKERVHSAHYVCRGGRLLNMQQQKTFPSQNLSPTKLGNSCPVTWLHTSSHWSR